VEDLEAWALADVVFGHSEYIDQVEVLIFRDLLLVLGDVPVAERWRLALEPNEVVLVDTMIHKAVSVLHVEEALLVHVQDPGVLIGLLGAGGLVEGSSLEERVLWCDLVGGHYNLVYVAVVLTQVDLVVHDDLDLPVCACLQEFVTQCLLDVLERLDDLLPVGALAHEAHMDVRLFLLVRVEPGERTFGLLEFELREEEQNDAHRLFDEHDPEEEGEGLEGRE